MLSHGRFHPPSEEGGILATDLKMKGVKSVLFLEKRWITDFVNGMQGRMTVAFF